MPHLPTKKVMLLTALTLAFVGALAVVVVDRSSLIVGRFKGRIETELSAALGRTVTVGSVEGGLFGSLTLRQVSLGPPAAGQPGAALVSARAESVVVRFSLWDLLVRRKEPLAAIRQIEFVAPTVGVSPETKAPGAPQGLSRTVSPLREIPWDALPPLPPITLVFRRGQLLLVDRALAVEPRGLLNDVSCRLEVGADGKARLRGRAAAPGTEGGDLKVSLDVDTRARQAALEVAFKGLALSEFKRLVFPEMTAVEVEKGTARGWLKASTAPVRAGQLLPGLETSAGLSVADGALYVARGDTRAGLTRVEGALRLKDSRLDLDGLEFNFGESRWTIAGLADLDGVAEGKMPRVSLKGSCPKLSLADLHRQLALPANVPLSGSLEASLDAQGPLDALDANMTVSGRRAGILDFDAQSPQARFHFAPGKVSLESLSARVDGGNLTARGAIDLTPLARGVTPTVGLDVRLERYPLGVFLARRQAAGITGLLEGTLSLEGPLDAPQARFQFDCPRLDLRGEPVQQARLSGTAGVDRLSATLSGSWRRLNPAVFGIELRSDAKGWRADSITLKRANKVLARGKGRLSPELALAVEAPSVDLADLPWLPASLEGARGKLALSAKASGDWNKPAASLSLRSAGLKSPQGRAFDLKAAGFVDAKGWKVETLELDGASLAARGSGGFDNGAWLVEAELDGADMSLLAELAGAGEGPRAGSASGHVSVSQGPQGLAADADLKAEGLDWAGFKASTLSAAARFARNRLTLEKLEGAQEGGGTLAGTADLDFAPNGGVLKAALKAVEWRFGARAFAFSAALSGMRGRPIQRSFFRAMGAADDGLASGDLAVTGAGVDGRPLENMEAHVTLEKGQAVRVDRLTWGAALQGEGRWSYGGSPSWKAAVRLKDWKAMDWMRLAAAKGVEAKPLAAGLSGVVEAEGDTRGVRVSAQMAHQAGALRVRGEAKASAGRPMRDWPVQGTFESSGLDLGLAAHFAEGAPDADWGGLLDAKIEVSGSLGKPKAAGGVWIARPKAANFAFTHLGLTFTAESDHGELTAARLVDGKGWWEAKGLKVRWQQGRVQVDGALACQDAETAGLFDLTGNGELSATVETKRGTVRAKARLPKARVNNMEYGPLAAEARFSDRTLKVWAAKREEPQAAGPGLRLEIGFAEGGEVRIKQALATVADGATLRLSAVISPGGGLRLDFDGDRYPADDIARVLGWDMRFTGRTWGHVTVRGDTSDPRVTATIKVEDGSVNRIPFDLFQGTIQVAQKVARFDPEGMPLTLTRKGRYTVVMAGTMPVGAAKPGVKPPESDFTITMENGDLSFLRFISAVEDASGRTEFKLHVTGTMAYPMVSGHINIANGVIVPTVLADKLTDVQGRIFISENRVDLYQMEARMGAEGQRLYVSRGPLSGPAVSLRQFVPDLLNLRVTSGKSGVKVSGRPALKIVEGTVAPDLLIQGSLDYPVLAGRLRLEEAVITYPPVVEKKPAGEEEAGPDLMKRTSFNMELETGRSVWYESDYANVQVMARSDVLRLKGRGDSLGLLGSMKAQRGEILYLNSSFRINESEESYIDFRENAPFYLEAKAYQTFRNLALSDDPIPKDRRVNMTAKGPMGKVEVTFEGEPYMTQTQISSLLGFGEDVGTWSGKGSDVQRGIFLLLGKAVSGAGSRLVGRQVKKLLPVDTLQFNLGSGVSGSQAEKDASGASTGVTQTASGVDNPLKGAQFTVGKSLNDKVFVNWRGSLDEKGINRDVGLVNNEVGVEYQLQSNKKLTLYQDFETGASKVGIEGHTKFGNYKPQRPTPTASPTPLKR